MTTPSDPPMRQQLQRYASALSTFSTSSCSSPFQILHSLPASAPPPSSSSSSSPQTPATPGTVYVLDSSFNPPTLAHLRIAASALQDDTSSPPPTAPKRLLLLLAIQNADKPAAPASFPHRLLMMTLFASDLLASLPSPPPPPPPAAAAAAAAAGPAIAIDIGVTTQPYFHSKATAIEDSGAYAPGTPQVHLTGFDTLIRILDPKYYPPSHTLRALRPFLARHRLRVAYRTGDAWGGREAQDAYLRELGEGTRERDGAARSWVLDGRIEMCEGGRGEGEGEAVISSSRVREAVRNGGGEEALRGLVSASVAEWILREGLYREQH